MSKENVRIGVVGAAGKLGQFMVRCLADQPSHSVALAREPVQAWPKGTDFLELSSSSPPGTLLGYSCGLDVVIIAAPVADHIYREALEGGCNIIDVGVDIQRVRTLLALDSEAKERGLNVLAMAGLAPGLMGRLAASAKIAEPDSEHIDVCLIQSADGSAGFKGTCEMLDALTGPDSEQLVAQIASSSASQPLRQSAMRFPTAETEIWPCIKNARYVTLFDQPDLNRKIRLLSIIRRVSYGLYKVIRDKIARSKAGAPEETDEIVTLSAVSVGHNDVPLNHWTMRFRSDYGATAAIACAAARMCVEKDVVPGARTLGEMFSLEELVSSPELVGVTVDN